MIYAVLLSKRVHFLVNQYIYLIYTETNSNTINNTPDAFELQWTTFPYKYVLLMFSVMSSTRAPLTHTSAMLSELILKPRANRNIQNLLLLAFIKRSQKAVSSVSVTTGSSTPFWVPAVLNQIFSEPPKKIRKCGTDAFLDRTNEIFEES